MSKIVVSDTTAIIHLSKIGSLNILEKMYSQILIPDEVFNELTRQKNAQPGALQAANSRWIKRISVEDKKLAAKLQGDLDLGESEAIALAIEQNADILIIDEEKGRNIAKKRVKKIIGIAGILVKAKEKGIIASVRPYLDKLRKTGFRLGDDVYNNALSLAGELDNQEQSQS